MSESVHKRHEVRNSKKMVGERNREKTSKRKERRI